MEEHLKAVYGHNKFRTGQKEIITDLLENNSVSAILPTGAGKSLLYQFPSTYQNSITIIISPLISLIADQCYALKTKGINCLNLSDKSNFCTNLKKCSCDLCKCYKDELKLSFIYCTPEWFSEHANRLYKLKSKMALIACDEAHCISNWSHDFRPSYKKIGNPIKNFAGIPILLVTASATPDVLEDIYNILEIEEISEYSLGSRRPNLSINIFDKSYWNFDIVNRDESTIIYTQSRKETESLTKQFEKCGINCLFYHAGMSDKDRMKVHTDFMNGKVNLIVATVAFGMGIDKSDIRHVINYGIPTDLETYYQEIGRAGRDGLPCKASMFYDSRDFSKALFLIKQGAEDQLEKKYRYLDIFKDFLEEANICRQYMIDNYLSTGKLPDKDIEKERCGICDNCRGEKQGVYYDITIDANKVLDILFLEPYAFGMTKTIQLCKSVGLKEYIKVIIEALIKQKLVKKINSKYGVLYEVSSKNYCENLQVLLPDTLYKSIMKNTNSYDRARKFMSSKYDIPEKTFLNDKVLLNIKQTKPSSLVELLMVDGIREEFVMNYGPEFIEITKPGCKQKEVECNKDKKVNTSISDTVQDTINLYKSGKTVKEISTIRNLKTMTVENHISQFYGLYPEQINQSCIKMNQKIIQEVIDAKNSLPDSSKLTPIMDQINNITWLQLKIIINAIKTHSNQELLNKF
tara:strand:+ start:1890 stop:3959 length:2070 start_codon:yes stop_codon:yes gene_type:complete